jgi:hypothetical protein
MPKKRDTHEEETEMYGGRWHGRHKRGGFGGLMIGIFLLLIGLGWLGNDMGWWNITLPWAPLAVLLVGVGLILGWAWRGRQD